MFAKKLIFAVAALTLAFGGLTARAQDNGALLDLLVRKRNHHRPGGRRTPR